MTKIYFWFFAISWFFIINAYRSLIQDHPFSLSGSIVFYIQISFFSSQTTIDQTDFRKMYPLIHVLLTDSAAHLSLFLFRISHVLLSTPKLTTNDFLASILCVYVPVSPFPFRLFHPLPLLYLSFLTSKHYRWIESLEAYDVPIECAWKKKKDKRLIQCKITPTCVFHVIQLRHLSPFQTFTE